MYSRCVKEDRSFQDNWHMVEGLADSQLGDDRLVHSSTGSRLVHSLSSGWLGYGWLV